MQATLISSEAGARGDRKRLVFTQAEGGATFGPFVEHRPEGENVDTFMAAHGVALLASLSAAAPASDPLGEAVALLKKHDGALKDPEVDAFLRKIA